MDTTTQATIEKITAQISVLEEDVRRHKALVNTLCLLDGDPPIYPDAELASTSVPVKFRSDHFFGRPMATAAREILEQRFARNLGAISLNELFETMQAGGFEFDNNNDQIAKRNLAITLSKNPAFTKVPSSGDIGLTEWYPNAKKKKDKTGAAAGEVPPAEVPAVAAGQK